MDSRLAALQQVILKKDLAILDLQTQLDAYRARYGELEPEDGDDAGEQAANPVAAAVAAASSSSNSSSDKTSAVRGKGSRQRSSSNSSSLPSWLTRATRSSSSSSPNFKGSAGPPSARSQTANLMSSPAALKAVQTPSVEGSSASSAVPDVASTIIAASKPSAPPDLPSLQSTADPLPATSTLWPSTPSGAADVDVGVTRATGKNIVLDFVEDSPMFRRQLEGFDESLTGLRALLRELQARTKEYVSAGMRFGDDEAALADELVARKHARALFTTSCPELGSLSSVFNQVHDTLAQLQSSRVSMLLSVEALLQHALESLADQELKDTLELRKEVSRLGDEYEAQLAKLLAKPRAMSSTASMSSSSSTNGVTSTPSASSSSTSLIDSVTSLAALGSPSVSAIPGGSAAAGGLSVVTDASANNSITTTSKYQRTLERDVLGARLRFELARFDLVRTLNRLDARKKVVLLECFNSTLYAFLGHFHACHELVKAIEPALRERQEALQVAKQDLDFDDAMWAAQRETLDQRLRADLERLLASGTSSGATTPSADASASASTSSSNLLAGGGGMPRSMDLPVEVISRETWSSRYEQRPYAEQPILQLETRQAPLAQTGDVVKQGYLFVRNTLFPARSWKRRWFQIHAGKLYQHRGGRQQHMDLVLVCDLLLARVREVGDASTASGGTGSSSSGASSGSTSGSASLPFCFEVIDASQARHLLQATSEREMRAWVDAAQRSTAAMLERQSHRMEVHPEQQAAVDELLVRNPSCADCGAKPADWVSINIGCLLCIECSGIHRSLGVHESKVRSLTLDSWDMALLALLRDRLGNDAVNAAWECAVPDGWARPSPQSSREDKTKWIMAKYHFHGFAAPVEGVSDDKAELERVVAERFLDAAARGDLGGLVWALAHGVEVNTRRPKTLAAGGSWGEGGESALHLSARAGAADCCDYLVLNGASLVATDARGKTPGELAAASGLERLARSLTQKEDR